MNYATRLGAPSSSSSPLPAEFVALVVDAANAYFGEGNRPRDQVLREGVQVLGRVFDACHTRKEFDDLTVETEGRLTIWIPDLAIELGHHGLAADGAALLGRLGQTLGYVTFPPELLAGMIEGMLRWGGEAGEFEIDLPPECLARLVGRLLTACPGHNRFDQLSTLLARSVWDWHEQATEMLAQAGVAIATGD